MTTQVVVDTGRASHENFPVASRVLPRLLRQDLMAVYGFARLVDDIGDEPGGPPGGPATPRARSTVLRELDDVEADVVRLYAAQPPCIPAVRALASTVQRHAIPRSTLLRLVEANRQDQWVSGYDTWEDLRGYCSLSADPVGEIVLHLFDAATPERLARSSSVCTALQLAEHLQDVAEDLERGRIYLPAADLAAFGCSAADLRGRSAPRSLRRVVAFETDRARALLADGVPLVRSLSGWARVAVGGYVAGGRATLTALADADYDVLARRPRPRARHLLPQWFGLLRGGTR